MAFPGTYNFSYYKGDTAEFVVRPKNANGTSFPLTGYKAKFTIADKRGSAPTYSDEAQAVVDETNNLVTCTILPGVGGLLSAGTYVYDVQVNYGANIIYTLLTGNITVTEQVSQSYVVS